MTPEQRASSEDLEAAIKRCMEAYGFMGPEDGVVTDWVVVIAQEGYDDDGDAKSGYTTLYSRGSLSTHKAIGLLHCGLRYIDMQEGELRGNDDN